MIGTALHGSTPSHELIHHISLPVLLHLIEAHHAWHTTHGHPTLPHAHLTSLVTAIVYSIWACLLLLLLLHELSLHHLLSRKYGSHLQICSLVQLLQLCNVTPLSQLLNVLLNGQVRCIRHLFPLLLQFLHLYMHRQTAVKECLNESAGQNSSGEKIFTYLLINGLHLGLYFADFGLLGLDTATLLTDLSVQVLVLASQVVEGVSDGAQLIVQSVMFLFHFVTFVFQLTLDGLQVEAQIAALYIKYVTNC